MIKKCFADSQPDDGPDQLDARLAAAVLNGVDTLTQFARSHNLRVPRPNKTARIVRMCKVDDGRYFLFVRGSKAFYAEIARFREELAQVGCCVVSAW